MILIVDDDEAIRSSLNLLLKRAGFEMIMAANPEQALEAIERSTPSLCILDMNFTRATSGEEGLKLLEQLKEKCPELPVILITAWGSIPLAVEGMKRGASDFITKPWNNDYLLASIKTILQLSRRDGSSAPSTYDRVKLNQLYNFENIIGVNDKLLYILNMVGRVSYTDAAILILGESGTGKELVAEAIHANSQRRNAPFVKVNLGGIPSALFESEMFGHKKGAFTGAVYDRIGRFESAHGGTIFLDEIGDLEQINQVKLLRVLQDRAFNVLGTSITKTVDFRLISATNRDLEQMVASGHFREDLFYRINLISLHIPPLRERPDDIALLVQNFVDNLKQLYGRPGLKVAPMAISWLKTLPWPGNIRELKNLVERTVLVTAHDIMEVNDFQDQYKQSPRQSETITIPAVGTVTLEEVEKSMIQKAMQIHQGNISRVARSLGLSRGALYRRLDKYGIPYETAP
ncbi:MAG: sigma-54 dependent transcriptional regulator [candidate division Zixibacteria bacterium]|nr:sigma-54 dependent transcriptional regulator [candidate division Zixibacteria bacterium]